MRHYVKSLTVLLSCALAPLLLCTDFFHKLDELGTASGNGSSMLFTLYRCTGVYAAELFLPTCLRLKHYRFLADYAW